MSEGNPNSRNRLLRSLGFLKTAWKAGALVLGFTLLTSALNSLEPMVQKVLIDALTSQGKVLWHNLTIGEIIFYVISSLALLTLIRGFFGNWTSVLTWRLKLLANRYLLDQAARTIYHQSLSYHRSARSGEIISNLDRGVTGFSSALSDVMINLLPNVLFLVCTFVFMLIMDVRLTLVAILFAPLPAIISVIAGRLSAAREKKIVKSWADTFARFQEGLLLAKTLKTFNLEKKEHDRFTDGVDRTHTIMSSGAMVDSIMNFLKNRIMDAGRLTVLCYGGILVANGEITIGTMVAFLTYTGNLFGPMLGLMNVYETLKKAQVYCDTVYDIIDTPNTVIDKPEAQALGKVKGAIEFDKVSFGYQSDQPVLKSLSVKMAPGSMVALVGASGSGKTTIIDLINRFYDPQSGRVLIDGTDMRDITQESLRGQIGMVLQDTALFNDTIKNNIACSRPEASDAEVAAAAKAAAADSFIARKPDRYDTIVGERGGNLSAGERQRVAIARAILKNPQIYIFDEASSNLDAESEELVSDVIGELTKNKTVIVIAHRLATIKNADTIIVLDNGQVVEQGTHEQLVALKGHYHKLLAAQSPVSPCPDSGKAA